MDKYETRRQALKDLVDSLGRGGVAAVADKIGKAPSYVSRMLYNPGKPGRKRIGEDSLEALSAAYPGAFIEQPSGAMDRRGGPDSSIQAEPVHGGRHSHDQPSATAMLDPVQVGVATYLISMLWKKHGIPGAYDQESDPDLFVRAYNVALTGHIGMDSLEKAVSDRASRYRGKVKDGQAGKGVGTRATRAAKR